MMVCAFAVNATVFQSVCDIVVLSLAGRWAEVHFTDDWSQDALRRDLTVNAMSIGLDGVLHDYFNGCQHLQERRYVCSSL